MPNLFTTVGQGANAFITMPACSINAGSNPGVSGIEFDVKPITGNSAGFFNIGGASANTTNALRIEMSTGTLQWRYNSSILLQTAAGVAPANERHRYGAEWDEDTSKLYLTKNGSRVAGPFDATPAQTSWTMDQMGKVGGLSPSTHAGDYYGVRAYGANSTYVDEWNGATSPSTGSAWTSVSGTRTLNMTSQTGAADSWLVPYSSGQPEAHVGGALLTIPADVITGGVFAQSQSFTGGALLTIPADVIAGGLFSETQHVTSGALLTLSADFIAGGVFAQSQNVTAGALLTIPADVITGGAFAQSQSFTGGALLPIPADVITGGTFAQSQSFTGGALLTIPADFIAGSVFAQSQNFTAGALLTLSADFITGGSIAQGDNHVSGALLTIAADFIAGGVFAQSQNFTAGALLTLSADFITGGSFTQGESYSSGALLNLSADFIAGGVFAQSQNFTAGALLTIPADVITGGAIAQGDHHVSGALLTVPADFIATGSFTQMEGFVGNGLLVVPADFIADGDIQYNPNVVGGALLQVACDFIVDGQYNQQYNYTGGAILDCNARFIAGGQFYQAIQKLRHSGHRVWNEQARQDQIQYVRQHPDNFTALLYLPAEPEAPAEVDDWLDAPLFGRVDANQKAGGYEDPKVCWVFERPREGGPFVVDAEGGDLVNEHEDYLTICAEMDLPVGAALEFEDELADGDTRRSWWYVHHITSYGTTKAGSVYYLIPLRDFTGLNT